MRSAALAAVLIGLCGCGRGAAYPNAPILLICPWAAGGGSDRVARQVAVLLEQELKVPVNVQNATGGDGVTGHSKGALARPDGYTMTLVTVEINMLHWRGLTSLSHRDFAPAALINRDSAAIFVRGDSPIASLRDLEARVRVEPGRLRASGTAKAGIWHVALAGWLAKAGLKPTDINWISIGGSAPSLAELLAGGVDVVCCSLPEAQALLEARRIRCLGVMSAERLARFPDVPTLRELGADWTMGAFRGVALPRGTPPEVMKTVVAALERVAKSEAFLSFMRNSGFGAACEGPEAFNAGLEKADVELGAILTSEAFRGLVRDRFGPKFFPTIVMIALGAVLAALVFRRGLKPTEPGVSPDYVRFAEVVLTIVLYILLAEALGFLLTAGLLTAALLWRMGTRPRLAGPVGALVVASAYQVFAKALNVPLPRGLLGW